MATNRKNRSSESGFTLIELLIAVVLIVFGLLAYGAFTGNLMVQNNKGARKTQAATYAQEMLEMLKNDALTTTLVASTGTDTGTDLIDGIYDRTWAIASAGGDAVFVNVTVSWANNTGSGNSSITFRTIISQ